MINRIWKNEFHRISVIVIVLIILIIFLYASIILFLTWPITYFSIEKAGQFGDSFGLISSIFSGLAFAGVILTITLQRKELQESRDIFRIQRFEGSFYKLLDLYRKNLEEIKVYEKQKEYKGIDALSNIVEKINKILYKNYKKLNSKVDSSRILAEVDVFVDIQKNINKQYRYLSTLRNLLQIVDFDLKSEEEKNFYWDIAASQITSHEAKYIFYVSLILDKNDSLYLILIKSDFLKSRLKNLNISKTTCEFYKRVHDIEIDIKEKNHILPYDKETIKIARHRSSIGAK